MTTEATNREMAAAARRAAEIIVERGKATYVYEDDRGRVCAMGALVEAEMGFGAQRLGLMSPNYEALAQRCEAAVEATCPSGSLTDWSDLPTTTEADIAALFLQVADDLGRSDWPSLAIQRTAGGHLCIRTSRKGLGRRYRWRTGTRHTAESCGPRRRPRSSAPTSASPTCSAQPSLSSRPRQSHYVIWRGQQCYYSATLSTPPNRQQEGQRR